MIRAFHQLNPKQYQERVKKSLEETQNKMYSLIEWKNKRLFLLPFDELTDAEKKLLFNDDTLQQQVKEYQLLSSQAQELEKLSSQWDKLDGSNYLSEAEKRIIDSWKAAKEAVASRANTLWAAAVANAWKAWLSSNQALKALADLTENVFTQQQQIEQQTQSQLAWIAWTKAQLAQQRAAMMNQWLLANQQNASWSKSPSWSLSRSPSWSLSRSPSWSLSSWWSPSSSPSLWYYKKALETQTNRKPMNIMEDYQEWLKIRKKLLWK